MTIVVTLKTYDGIVLGADSASTISVVGSDGREEEKNIFNNANKILNIYKGLPLGFLSCGLGNVGYSSVCTLAKDFREKLSGDDPKWAIDPHSYTVLKVAELARKFFYEDVYQPHYKEKENPPVFEFFICGYSSESNLADAYSVLVEDGKCDPPKPLFKPGQFGIYPSGQPEAIYRLIRGFDWESMHQWLTDGKIPEEEASGILGSLEAWCWKDLHTASMPVQDSIDLVRFLLDLTCQYVRFRPGSPTVGGPLEIAAITKHEGFRWIQRKLYFDLSLNPKVEKGIPKEVLK